MSTYTYAESFTRVHARRLSGRVTTDLRQSYILYDRPSAASLEDYRVELEELLLGGYVEQYQFGFKKESRIVWSLRYIVRPDGALTGGAGGVPVGVDVSDATWFNSAGRLREGGHREQSPLPQGGRLAAERRSRLLGEQQELRGRRRRVAAGGF